MPCRLHLYFCCNLLNKTNDLCHLKDRRFAHTPYHALTPRERELYNARCQLLTVMGEHLRKAALSMEKQRLENELHQDVQSESDHQDWISLLPLFMLNVECMHVHHRC